MKGMIVYIVAVLLLLTTSCTSIQITDPNFSFSSDVLETHLVFKTDPNRAANAGIELTVALSGAGAPSVTAEDVLTISGGTVVVKLATNPVNNAAGNLRHSPFLTSALLLVLGAFTGLRFRYLGIFVISIALLMGGCIALTTLDPSWKLTVTATIPPSMSMTSLNVKIARGSVSMMDGSLAVTSSVSVDLCQSVATVSSITMDVSSLSLAGESSFCATNKVELHNTELADSARLTVTSLQDSGFVFVKKTYIGAYDVSSNNGFAIATSCSTKNETTTDTRSMKGKCGLQVGSQPQVKITAFNDAVMAMSENVSNQLKVAKRWSDPNTWGGQIPQNGSSLVITTDQVILLDTTTAQLKNLEIRGTLIADQGSDFLVTADSINLYGTLRVGSVNEPYTGRGVFTLTGAKGNYTSRAPLLGFSNSGASRVLMVHPNANLFLYGALPRRTYTRLNDHAAVNSTLLTLDTLDSAWRVGDEIVISPTTFPSTSRSDKRKIIAIDTDQRQVTIDKGLSFARWGKLQYATDNGISLQQGVFSSMKAHPNVQSVIDERAVIIHLTRNIVINAVNDTDWRAGHGVHVMWNGLNTQVQLSGVEVHRCGQAGALGRYPLHAHMQSYKMEGPFTSISDGTFIGNAVGVFVRNCAIHNSVNRAITIHGTCGARFENNVAFNIIGHGYFFEDGSEMNNHFIGNVILNVQRPADNLRLLSHDDTSSGVWFTNGRNHFRNNIAGDIIDGHGMWNSLARRPSPSYVLVSKPDSITFTFYVDQFRPKLETWTATNLNATHWSVVGSVSGRTRDMDIRVADMYDNSIIVFKLVGSASVGDKVVFNIEGYAGGCFGQSRNVPINPQYQPMIDYTNNTAFATARSGITTDLFVIDELGTLNSDYTITTSDGEPDDVHNGIRKIPTHFDSHRIWMCSGGAYTNRLYDPLYTRWVVSDNLGTDLSGATQHGTISQFLFVGNSLNRLESVLYDYPRHAFATYHFSVTVANISLFNYPRLPDPAAKTAYNLLEMSGVMQSWDLYLGSIELGTVKNSNWKQFNCAAFERTPPANIEYLYPNNSGGAKYWPFKEWTLSGALYDNGGLLAGRHGDYIIFDHPFLNYKLKDVRPVIPGSRTLATSDKFVGIYLQEANGQRVDYAPVTYMRLDDNYKDVTEGGWILGDGDNSIFFKYMRHASMVSGGKYRIFNHVDTTPNYSKYQFRITKGDFNWTCDLIIGIPWSGTVPVKVSKWSEAITEVSSRAIMDSTPNSFFQETSTNQVWYHHVDGWQYWDISFRPK